MSIRTSKNNKGHILSFRSPVRTLLHSEFQSAINWISRRKDADGNRIGKITTAESVVKYGKDCFSLYGFSTTGKSVSINDVRGDAVFIRVLSDGKIDTADIFVFCLGAGRYLICDWMKVWRTLDHLKGKGTVIYQDCWRLNKKNFIGFLETII